MSFFSRQENPLDHNNIAWSSLFYKMSPYFYGKISWNFALFKLVWSLLNSNLLIAYEFRMAWQKWKFSCCPIFNTYFRLTLNHRPKFFIINLIIILTPTTITSISSNNKLRLNLRYPNNHRLTDNKCSNFIRTKITNTLKLQFRARSINNHNITTI